MVNENVDLDDIMDVVAMMDDAEVYLPNKHSTFGVMTPTEIEALAASKGCSVIVAQPNELQFDLDTQDSYVRFESFFTRHLCKRWPSATVTRWNSKSGNWHAVVTLPEVINLTGERIALQAMGGSDPGREFSALMCAQAGSDTPIVLFKPKNLLLGDGR